MTETEPQQLLKMIQEGDEEAFLELYNRWHGAIYRFAWQMTGSVTMAEDIMQDVYLLIIRKKLHFDPAKGGFSSFIYGVARNLAFKAVRKNQRLFGILQIFENQRMHQSIVDPFFQMANIESSSHLRRCILSLPSQYREVIVLCDLHEMSYAQVANVTRSAVGTVRSRLHRGRELLMQKMRSWEEADHKNNKGEAPYEIPAL